MGVCKPWEMDSNVVFRTRRRFVDLSGMGSFK
jgi:hypothetical protein